MKLPEEDAIKSSDVASEGNLIRPAKMTNANQVLGVDKDEEGQETAQDNGRDRQGDRDHQERPGRGDDEERSKEGERQIVGTQDGGEARQVIIANMPKLR